MPHLIVDYSPNLDGPIDMQGLCNTLCKAAGETAILPVAGVRVRAHAADYYAIADGNTDHGYIHVTIRLRGGRTLEDRQAAIEHIFAALLAFVQAYLDTHSLAVSMEMVDIDPELSPKTGTIRKYLRSA